VGVVELIDEAKAMVQAGQICLGMVIASAQLVKKLARKAKRYRIFA
jgi:hypothetical protein